MALANIVRAAILSPSRWNTNALNSNTIAGNEIYCEIQARTALSNDRALNIPPDVFLELRNLDVIRNSAINFFKMAKHTSL